MKTTKTRYFIVAPGNEYGYKDVLGFVVYPDGRAKRFCKNKKPPIIGDRCSKEETLSDHKLGRLVEIPTDFMMCVEYE